jgi:hypothetical protein
MDKKQVEIFVDAIIEIAKKYDTCGVANCNRIHATIGVWTNKEYLHEAIELAKQKGFNNV